MTPDGVWLVGSSGEKDDAKLVRVATADATQMAVEGVYPVTVVVLPALPDNEILAWPGR